MGKTYLKNQKDFDSNKRSVKRGGMKTLNSYVEDDYDDFDLNDNSFDDKVELDDDISIQHNTNTK